MYDVHTALMASIVLEGILLLFMLAVLHQTKDYKEWATLIGVCVASVLNYLVVLSLQTQFMASEYAKLVVSRAAEMLVWGLRYFIL